MSSVMGNRGLQFRAAIRTVLLALFVASPSVWSGNPVPADGLSLLNGAEYFKQFCTECHGWDPAQQYTSMYSEDPFDAPDPLFESDLPEEGDAFVEEPEDDWPDWAGPAPVDPVPQAPGLRSEVLNDLNSAIDEFYQDDVESSDWSIRDVIEPGDSGSAETRDVSEDDSGRIEGATDLTNPLLYIYGSTEDDLFDHIAYGTGPTMPGFLNELGSEEAVWDLVNYIRSLWGEGWLY